MKYNKKFTIYELCIQCHEHCKASGLGAFMLCPRYVPMHRQKHTPDLEHFLGQPIENIGKIENG